ncbi:MAG: response regulator [Polyangia bacterium]
MNTCDTEGTAQGSADDAALLFSDSGAPPSPLPGPRLRRLRASFRILLVEPLPAHRKEYERMLRRAGFDVTAVEDAEQALDQALAARSFHLVLTELRLPRKSGLHLVQQVRAACPHTAVFVATGQPSIASAVDALKLGAAEYLSKPLSPLRLLALCDERCEQAPRFLPNALLADPAGLRFEGLIAHAPGMQAVLHALERLAATVMPLLLLGEAGTGKAQAAQAVHRRSERASAPFRVLRPGAPGLSYFGVQAGDGSAEREKLLAALAAGGTLYIDELGALDPAAQAVLATALRSPGPNAARVICGSRLEEPALLSRLDPGLWAQLGGRALKLPPLRARRADIVPLALELLRELAAALGRPAPALSPEVQRRLEAYAWPGNVSELRALLDHALVRTPESGPCPTVEAAVLPLPIGGPRPPRWLEIPVGVSLHEVERHVLRSTLELCAGNRSKVAATLGISRSCLYDMLARHQDSLPAGSGSRGASGQAARAGRGEGA